MHWAGQADLLADVQRRCAEMGELIEPLGDLELLARVMLVAARASDLDDVLKEQLRREDGEMDEDDLVGRVC